MAIDYGKRSGLVGSGLYNIDYPVHEPELVSMNRSPVLNGSTGAFENSMHEDLKASNDDSVTNQRYADLQLRRDELKQQIMDLKADIAYQEKLRGLEMSKDPMWDAAKYKFIYDNDSSALENIMNRQQTMKVAKMNKEKEQTEKKEASMRSAKFARDMLDETLKDYEDAQADPNKRIEIGKDLLDKYMQYKEKADAAGLNEAELYKDNPGKLQMINLAIQEARLTQKDEIAKSQERVKKQKTKQQMDNEVKNAVDSFNIGSHSSSERKAKKQDLAKQYPDFNFTVKDGKIVATRKAGT